MVNINEFIVKPVPKKLEDVVLNIKNVDLREENRINRDEVIERLHRLMKGLSVEPLKIDKEEEEEEMEEDQYKDDDSQIHAALTKEKRLTKKQTSIQENIKSITFSDELKENKNKSRKQKIVHKIPSRQEFIENMKKLFPDSEDTPTCDNYDTKIQQQVIVKYLNLNTPYRGLLLYHGIGSGKTCTSIVAAEGMKSAKKIVVLTPQSLTTNFFKEIKKCGDESYRTNQQWTKKMISERREAEELSKVVALDVDTILEKGVWLGTAEDGDKFSELTIADQEEVNIQVDKMIRAKYKSISYNQMTEELMKKLTENETKNPFDDSVVIIDEVHNFVRQIAKENDPISVRLYHYLMAAQHCKLVFLSGTPIVEAPYEIAIIFNMLHGYIRKWTVPLIGDHPKIAGVEYKDNAAIITQNAYMDHEEIDLKEVLKSLNADRDPTLVNYKILPDEESSFNKKFIEKDRMTNRDAFQRRILGLTSYFEGAPEELMPKYDRNRDFVIIRVPMSDYQANGYKKALEKDDKDKKYSREACNYVAPTEEKELNKDALITFSPKCLHMLENIQDEEGLHMVYSELSCEIIREILLANGFDEFKLVKGAGGLMDIESESEALSEASKSKSKSKKHRFVSFSAIKDQDERETILDIYNHNWSNLNPVLQEKLETMSKEIIKVFMISDTDAEGISLKNTRFVHIVEPSVNATRIDQVVGRARRMCSHTDLPEELRTVKAYLYMSTLVDGDKKSTDELIFETANEKDHLNQEVLRAVKETAMDCSLYEKDAICYKLGGKEELKSNTIIGGKRYNRDKENNIYEVDSEKPFGKLVKEENAWVIQ